MCFFSFSLSNSTSATPDLALNAAEATPNMLQVSHIISSLLLAKVSTRLLQSVHPSSFFSALFYSTSATPDLTLNTAEATAVYSVCFPHNILSLFSKGVHQTVAIGPGLSAFCVVFALFLQYVGDTRFGNERRRSDDRFLFIFLTISSLCLAKGL